MQAPKFTNCQKTDFYRVLTQRVNNYFVQNNLSKHANADMVFKTILMLALYFVPYFIILFGNLSVYAMWALTVVMGIGVAGIGMSIMHDANHGAYSAKAWVNSLLGYTLNLIGGDASNWKIQHNKLHHIYTNIHNHDLDIRENFGLRFTPAVQHKPFQRFQVLYVFFLYALQTFSWILLKDFNQFFKFKQANNDGRNNGERIFHFVVLVFSKLAYIGFAFVLPLLLVDITWWQLLIGFMTMHAVGGLILSIVFQMAHVIEETEFPMLNEAGNISNEWAIHQMQTTANFGHKNKLLTYFVGGLNYQVEHHLFTKICHVHYPQIAPIVEATAKEFGVPYLNHTNLSCAFSSHINFLKKLGRNEVFEKAVNIG